MITTNMMSVLPECQVKFGFSSVWDHSELDWSLTLRNLLPNLSELQDESDNRGSALLQGEGHTGRVADLEGAIRSLCSLLILPTISLRQDSGAKMERESLDRDC